MGRTLGLVAAAVIGGLTALGGAALAGKLGSQTTYRPIVAPSTSGAAPASFAGSKALSIHQIYERWAPGVVQITSTSVVNVPQDPIFGNPVRAAAAGAAVARLGLRHRQGRPRRHELPRGRGREVRAGQLLER